MVRKGGSKHLLYWSRVGWISIQRVYARSRKRMWLLGPEDAIPYVFFIKEKIVRVRNRYRSTPIGIKNYAYGRRLRTVAVRWQRRPTKAR